MSSGKRVIGIFFGIDNLEIAEIENKNLIDQYCTPYVLSPEEKETSFNEIDKNKLATILQKALKEKAIETKDAIVSLPIRNIILRSFFMPIMPREELDAAIKFEAKKYIPFRLENLIYDYQSYRLKEDKGRKSRILFVGIKKELLQKYSFALEQSDLKIKYIEPSAVSLLRALIFKEKVDRRQTQAVVGVNNKGGNIIISDSGIPTFINDFKFSTTTSEEDQMQNDILLARLANDIRLAVDYYQRHTSKTKIGSIVLCYEEISQEVIDGLKKEIDIPITSVETKEILGLEDSARIGLLHAYGAGMRNYVPAGITIDLNRTLAVVDRAELLEALAPEPLTPRQIKKLIQAGIIAAILVCAFFLFNLRQVLSLKSQISKQRIEVKPELISLSKGKLEKKLIEVKKKIGVFSSIKKEKTFTPLLNTLPKLLPEGVWLKTLSFNAKVEKNVKELNMSGSCYREDHSMQINAVNQFILNLKKNLLFSKEFRAIDITSITQREVDNWVVTDFVVICR
ncbi:MAG: pilus assembly protein PilM [Candidatus Omnitrophica bacterium]|nr:pilus assembly protein PilM [Candidatus Omnitrophota bacterium]